MVRGLRGVPRLVVFKLCSVGRCGAQGDLRQGESKRKSVTPTLPQPNPLGWYLSCTKAPLKILFDSTVVLQNV